MCQITRWDDEIYIKSLRKQIRAADKNELISCRCGNVFYLHQFNRGFRCFFCGEWFCQTCAKEHFNRSNEIFTNGLGI